MDFLWLFFWFCWTLFFGLIFIDRILKGIKSFVVHFYFRGKAHFDVETDFNNKEQLDRIESLFEDQRTKLVFHLSDSKKPIRNRLENIEKLLIDIKNELDRED